MVCLFCFVLCFVLFWFLFFFTLPGDTIDDQSRESKDKTSFPETRPMYNQPPQVGDLFPYAHMMNFHSSSFRKRECPAGEGFNTFTSSINWVPTQPSLSSIIKAALLVIRWQYYQGHWYWFAKERVRRLGCVVLLNILFLYLRHANMKL